jgi:predicted nucleic acid-binding protein
MFDERVLEVSEDVVLKWRLLVEGGRKAGHSYSQLDLFIAATALLHASPSSRDQAEYRRAGVAVFNPWTEPFPRAG